MTLDRTKIIRCWFGLIVLCSYLLWAFFLVIGNILDTCGIECWPSFTRLVEFPKQCKNCKRRMPLHPFIPLFECWQCMKLFPKSAVIKAQNMKWKSFSIQSALLAICKANTNQTLYQHRLRAMLCPGISRHAIAQAERDSVWNLSVRLKPTTGVFEFSESFKKIFVIKSWSLWWGAILWPEECAAPSVRFLPLLQNIHVILVILSHCLKATNFRSSDFTIHLSGGWSYSNKTVCCLPLICCNRDDMRSNYWVYSSF